MLDTIDREIEFAVRAETKTGDVLTLRRRFKTRDAAEEHPVQLSKWNRVWVEEMPRAEIVKITKPEPNPDDPPPYPWTVQWRGGFAYIVDADGKKIASLLGSKKRKEYTAKVLGSLR